MKGLGRKNQTNYLRPASESHSKVTENEILGWEALAQYLGRNINYAKSIIKPDASFPVAEKRRIRHYDILVWNKTDVDAWALAKEWKK